MFTFLLLFWFGTHYYLFDKLLLFFRESIFKHWFIISENYFSDERLRWRPNLGSLRLGPAFQTKSGVVGGPFRLGPAFLTKPRGGGGGH